MAQLSTKIEKLVGRKVDFTSEVLLQDDSDGNGPYIKHWGVDGVAKPTADQLALQEDAANTEEANRAVVAERKKLYGSLEQQIENIIENGLDAEIARVAQIKADNPKQ